MNSNVRVLMFGWELPPHNSGGLGVACHGLTKGLAENGVQITFVMPKKMDVNAPFMEVRYDEVTGVKEISINSLLQAYMTAHGYKKMLYNGELIDVSVFGDSLYEEALRFGAMAGRWAENIAHDVIHVHDWMTFPAGMEASRISGKPWVAHVHATEYDRAGEKNVDTRIVAIEREGLNDADKVICVSEFTKKVVMDRYGVPEERIAVVHNGVMKEDFERVEIEDLLPDSQVVLFLGRLTMQKGPEYFLQTAKRVLEVKPDTLFVVAGSGDLEKKLMIMAATLGISHRVIFTGFLRGKAKSALFQRADVFVMPSVSEPFGIVALEALAREKPVILSRQSGAVEIIKHALKADFWDTERMADLIVNVLEHPEMAGMLASYGHDELKDISWEQAAQRTVGVYRGLVG